MRLSRDLESMRYDATTATYGDLPTYPTRPSYREFNSALHISTQCVCYEGAPHDPHKPSSVPIYQTAVSRSARPLRVVARAGMGWACW